MRESVICASGGEEGDCGDGGEEDEEEDEDEDEDENDFADLKARLVSLRCWGSVPVGLSLYFPSIWKRVLVPELRGHSKTGASRTRRWKTYSSRGGLLVAGLASHLESDAIGGGVLELEGGGGKVVEILVEEL